MADKNKMLRQLPKVDEVMKIITEEKNMDAPLVLVKHVVRMVIDRKRQQILSGKPCEFSKDELIYEIETEVGKQNQPHLKKVINATGVVLHTNLGRAKLPKSVSKHLADISESYSNLEYDLVNGERGSRYTHVEELLKLLTGSEAALVVNNNAAAVYLVLDSMVKGKEVIVSRGELVEIGGSFRVPNIMKTSGCSLVEVGTTNKTHPKDYEEQIGDATGALLKVHTSNYKIIGFTEDVSLEQLKAIGVKNDLPVIYDLGSGLLMDLSSYGISGEPTVSNCVEQGADIVCFSGDKLLGGPQAGIIVGSAKYINQMKKNHLLRALRIDKLTLTALELTLREYLSPEKAVQQIPTLKMIAETKEHLREKADVLYHKLIKRTGVQYEVIYTDAQIGGGTLPGVNVPSYAVGVRMQNISADALEQQMRAHTVPIAARIMKDKVLLDVRTMEDEEMEEAAEFFNNFNLKGDTQ